MTIAILNDAYIETRANMSAQEDPFKAHLTQALQKLQRKLFRLLNLKEKPRTAEEANREKEADLRALNEADQDGDNLIDQRELAESLALQRADTDVDKRASIIMRTYDINHDGLLDEDEQKMIQNPNPLKKLPTKI